MVLESGSNLLHYRILERIGVGGMGEVYRAADTKLGREVALKVLPPDLAADPDRLDRFRREATALAALDHPGIVTVFSVEDAAGVPFLTMQLVAGKPLDHVIAEGRLSGERLQVLALGIAEALAAAHARGIVHRDLKPANVMVTDSDQVKVLDFGLARMTGLVGTEGGEADQATLALTRSGVVMGTPAYMSPEQISGRFLDHRTDLFSLGILLHEMASGERPFRGETAAELAASILRDTPRDLAELRPDLSAGWVCVVARCLEKDPGRRYASVDELIRQLRSEGSPGTASPGTAADDSGKTRTMEGFWVAVLPFQFRGSDSSLEGLAESLTDELVTGLSRFSYLRVIARSSTSGYAGARGDVRAIGSELGARYVLDGNLRQAGSALRITAQLVDARSGAHLWAESYDRPYRPEEFFALVDDIAPRIGSTVADMHGVLPRTMSESLRGRDPGTLSPYEAVLRSFGYVERLNEEEHEQVRAGLENAIPRAAEDPDIWAMLSFVYAEEVKHGFNVRPGALDRSLEMARRAVAIAPTSHLAYHVLAQALFFRRELPAFRNAAERAIALNPMDGCTLAFMGILLAYAGEWDRGCALAEHAMELNPHHPGWYRFSLYFNAYRKREYREALEIALRINLPSYFYTHMALAAAYGQLGDVEAGKQAVRELLELKPDSPAVARTELGQWLGAGPLLDDFMEGLRKAGLPVSPEDRSTD